MTLRPELTQERVRLTIGILTLNEEKRIASCINSAKFADQIVVVDSGSKDRTREIAASLGAEVYDYPDWQGFAVQRNRSAVNWQQPQQRAKQSCLAAAVWPEHTQDFAAFHIEIDRPPEGATGMTEGEILDT